MNERQAEALQRAAEALRCAAASAADGLPLDFWALDLRGALLALGEARTRRMSAVHVPPKKHLTSCWTVFWALGVLGALLTLGDSGAGVLCAVQPTSRLCLCPVLIHARRYVYCRICSKHIFYSVQQVMLVLLQVTGDEASEEVLDDIFSRFCIGK